MHAPGTPIVTPAFGVFNSRLWHKFFLLHLLQRFCHLLKALLKTLSLRVVFRSPQQTKGQRHFYTIVSTAWTYFRMTWITAMIQGPVVQTLDSAIHWINQNTQQISIWETNYTILQDCDLSSGSHYPPLVQLGPDDYVELAQNGTAVYFKYRNYFMFVEKHFIFDHLLQCSLGRGGYSSTIYWREKFISKTKHLSCNFLHFYA